MAIKEILKMAWHCSTGPKIEYLKIWKEKYISCRPERIYTKFWMNQLTQFIFWISVKKSGILYELLTHYFFFCLLIGCGKTTQIPQYILDNHILNLEGSTCRIVCTQPRRISAITVAERVAQERGEPLGESVGYHIRLEPWVMKCKTEIKLPGQFHISKFDV